MLCLINSTNISNNFEVDKIFINYMKELIRKIIKESIDEFDWVDVNPNTYNSGQGLFNLMQDFLKSETNGKYYLEQDMNIIDLSDNTGIYYSYNSMQDFTIDNIVHDFERTLNYYDRHSRIGQEYQQLAKILEPIIGPINSSTIHFNNFVNESEEFDWVDVGTSNLSGQNLYNMIQELFNLNNSMYQIKYYGKPFSMPFWTVGDYNGGIIEISDNIGLYLEYAMEDFTVNNIHKDLSNIINGDTTGSSVRLLFLSRAVNQVDYMNLAKALEPIIGPIN